MAEKLCELKKKGGGAGDVVAFPPAGKVLYMSATSTTYDDFASIPSTISITKYGFWYFNFAGTQFTTMNISNAPSRIIWIIKGDTVSVSTSATFSIDKEALYIFSLPSGNGGTITFS